MTGAREEVLARIRRANGPGRAPVEVPRAYRRTGAHSPGHPALLDLLEDRLRDYGAAVRRTSPDGIAEAVRASLTGAVPGDGVVVVPTGLPEGWVQDGRSDEPPLSVAELDRAGAAVTAAAAACAETGTIVLDGSPDQGRRVLTLVPDVHVCVVRADQVVETVPELVARVDPTRPLTFVSGPSATSDIELSRVEGVHGPRTLSVVLVDG